MNGVTFGTKHSYKDWGLILKSRPEISPPSPKTVYVDIPASDGSLDLTESLTGEVKFENRKIKFEFTVLEARNRWSNIYSEILGHLHGQTMKVILDEDSAFYYVGRLQVDEWKSDKRTSTIVISGIVEPYKMQVVSSTEDWLWDSFNFETDEIHEWGSVEVDGTKSITFNALRKTIVPTFTVTSEDGSGISIRISNSSKGQWVTGTLADGTTKNPKYKIFEGYTYLVLSGKGTVSIEYRGGKL